VTPRAAVRVAALAAWFGAALLLAAAVAPAAFAVLPSRALAGDLVGRVLPVVFWAAVAVAILVIAARDTAMASTPFVSRTWALGVPATIALAALANLWIVDPRIASLRAGGPIDVLPVNDPRRILFGRLHLLSVALLGVAMLAVAALLVHEWHHARPGRPTGGRSAGPSVRELP
jgi:Domain of unknown function (DUF4149)